MVKPATECSVPVFFGEFFTRGYVFKMEIARSRAYFRSPMGTTVAGMSSIRCPRGCFGRKKVEIAPKGAVKGIEAPGLRGLASGTNARSELFGWFER